MLFPADSVEGNDFFQKRPSYITQTDKEGNFSFRFLKNIQYKILGVVDEDQSNTYSQPSEKLALADSSLIVFNDTSTSTEVFLYAFQADELPPSYRGYDRLNDSVLMLRFNERYLLDSLELLVSDTLQSNLLPAKRKTYLGGTDHELLMLFPSPGDTIFQLHINRLLDSLYNREDSLILVRPGRKRTVETPLFKRPAFNFEKERVELIPAWLPSPIDTNKIVLTDTTTQRAIGMDSLEALFDDIPYVKAFPFDWVTEGFQVTLLPKEEMDPEKDYILHIPGDYIGLEDTFFRYKVNWPNIEEFGTWQGSIEIPDYEGPVVVYLFKEQQLVRTTFDTVFSYKWLEPGDYHLRVVMDEDSNFTHTPGSLDPYSLPEKIFDSKTTVTIRANWDIEEQIIDVNPFLTIQPLPPDTTQNAVNTPPNSNTRNNTRSSRSFPGLRRP